MKFLTKPYTASQAIDAYTQTMLDVQRSVASRSDGFQALERRAQAAELRQRIEEAEARAEFARMTREEMAQFREWLRQRGDGWEP